MTSLHRYKRSHDLFANYFDSKRPNFIISNTAVLDSVGIQAGLYKINSLLPEHGLILSNLTGQPSQTNFQLHGKRQRRTVSTGAQLTHARVWPLIDKFMHELITHMQDFSTPKSRKSMWLMSHTLRIRQKFTIIDSFEDLIENVMYDTNKGIYLPLTLHFNLKNAAKSSVVETYLRMLQLPISLFLRKPRPAFDDKVVFSGLEQLYRDTTVLKRKK
jgi:hypothetical protein